MPVFREQETLVFSEITKFDHVDAARNRDFNWSSDILQIEVQEDVSKEGICPPPHIFKFVLVTVQVLGQTPIETTTVTNYRHYDAIGAKILLVFIWNFYCGGSVLDVRRSLML